MSEISNKETNKPKFIEGLADEIKLTEQSMSNLASKINPKVYYGIAVSTVLALVVILFILLFTGGKGVDTTSGDTSKSNEASMQITSEVLLILFFTAIFIGLIYLVLPNISQAKNLFPQITNVLYIFIYTVFLILFFRNMPTSTLDNYAFLIFPITVILTIYMLYKSSFATLTPTFNFNYERIKTLITFLCMITIFILFYIVDPGGYVSKYFGSTSIITIMVAILSFAYVLILLLIPDKSKMPQTGSQNFLENFSLPGVLSFILFLVFLVVTTISVVYYPGGFLNDKSNSPLILFLILTICIIWGGGMLISTFSDTSGSGDKTVENSVSFFKKILLALFGFGVSFFIILWLVLNLQDLSGQSSIVSFVLNLILILTVLILVYKTINVKLPDDKTNIKKNAFFAMIFKLFFYIPCFLSDLFDSVTQSIPRKKEPGKQNEYDLSNITSIIALILGFMAFYNFPSILQKFTSQGGNILVSEPLPTNTMKTIASYEELNGTDQSEYQYGLSCWFYLNALPPNTNDSYSRYTSILNYGNKPNVQYNPSTNTLLITMEQKGLTKDNNKLFDFDENGHRIIYKMENVELQKWNNIIINFVGGTLDVFYNNELVKSAIEVVPYITLDNLTIGQDGGLIGAVNNVIYFKNPLKTSQMYILYHTSKNYEPSLTIESK